MRRSLSLALTLSLCSTGIATAQQTPDRVRRIIAATRLPVSTAQARNEGVPDSEVRSVLDAMRRARVRADEARDVIDEARTARRQHGPVDNFGAFVQGRLAAGLRGRELAAAIRAEHAARGKGRAGQPARARGSSDASRGKAGATKGKAAPRDTVRPRSQKGGQVDQSTKAKRPETSTKGRTKRPIH
jgi:hypothetical protein